MSLTHNEKKSIINAHFRDIRTSLYILQSMGGRHVDHKNAIEMVTEGAMQGLADASDLFDELVGEWAEEPVADLIDAYQASEKAYNDAPTEDRTECDETREKYCAAIDAIKNGDVKAVTLRGVEAAIRQALKEECDNLIGEKPTTLTVALLEMAVGYFDGRAVEKSNSGEN